MKLLEYEAKTILKTHRVSVPESSLVDSADIQLGVPIVLKSQVPVGGRGKAGGVLIVQSEELIAKAIRDILALSIKGHRPRVLLAEEPISIKHEYYISLIIDKLSGTIRLMAHKDGGMEVEEQTGFRWWCVDSNQVTINTLARELTNYFELIDAIVDVEILVKNLYSCFIESDMTLLEINPLVLTTSGEFVAGDCKMTLDDAARFRHPNWNFEEETANTNFVTLDQEGTVATIANGAGLAMATVDAVADAGLTPANFLDVGGGANEASVLEAFSKIVEYPNISAIVINIFAGITRCDEVAKAILAAKSKIPKLPKLYVRLAGTNYEAAQTILEASSTPLLPSLEACIQAIKEDAL